MTMIPFFFCQSSKKSLRLVATVGLCSLFGCQDDSRFQAEPTSVATPVSLGQVAEGERASPAPVVLQWETAATGTIVVDEVELLVENPRDELVVFDLTIVAMGLDQRSARKSMGSHSLLPKQKKVVRLPASSLPMRSATSSCELVAQAVVAREALGPVTIASPSLYYHTPHGEDVAVAYNVESLIKDFHGGSVDKHTASASGSLILADGSVETVATGHGAAAVPKDEASFELGETTLGFETSPEKPQGDSVIPQDTRFNWRSFRICTNWKAQFTDAGFGEDYAAAQGLQDLPARHALGTIRRASDGVTIWHGWLNENGCSPLVELAPDSYELLQYSVLSDGSRSFMITHNVSGSNHVAILTTAFHLYSFLYPYYSITQTLHPTYHQPVTRVSAVVGQLMATPDHGIVAGGYTVRANTPCPSGTTSCYSPNDQIAYVESSDSNWKIVIAHEIGHQIQDRAIGDLSTPYYQDASQTMCRCDHVADPSSRSHCLQSRENMTAAQVEGFAQFAAAKAFNNPAENDCNFAYYKEFKAPQGGLWYVLSPPVARTCRTNQTWMETYCATSNAGVEWDWQIFYWNLNTVSSSKTTMPELWAIYGAACGGSSCDEKQVSWNALDGAAQTYHGFGTPKYFHFADAADAAGVNH